MTASRCSSQFDVSVKLATSAGRFALHSFPLPVIDCDKQWLEQAMLADYIPTDEERRAARATALVVRIAAVFLGVRLLERHRSVVLIDVQSANTPATIHLGLTSSFSHLQLK